MSSYLGGEKVPTVLITGIAGFVGSHLADSFLQDSTIEIAGILHPTHEVQHLEDHPRVTIYREDILKNGRLARLLKRIAPEAVYHLAGMANVHESWTNRRETIETNFFGTFNLLEACRGLAAFPKILLVGSGECYGIVPAEEQPISEIRPLVPSSPYAVSKIAQEMLAIQVARAEGLPIYLSRSFNHTGPRQKESFVCSAFAKQIAIGEREASEPEIRVGNLIARRDFSDVRDVVRAYQLILEKGRPAEPYNVCSGKAISIQEVLELLLSFASRKFRVVVDDGLFRPADMPLLLGNPEKLRRETDWSPYYDIRRTLQDLLQHWREKLKTDGTRS